MRVEGPVLEPWRLFWELVIGWMWMEKHQGPPGFWLGDWVDGSANKRGAVNSSGAMYSWGQVEF